MGIALLALEGLFSPLQSLLNQANARRQALACGTRPVRTPAVPASANDDTMRDGRTASRGTVHGLPTARQPSQAHRPLRVVRVIDPKAHDAGRLVISGRMADVCAELDRLAELESRLH